MSVSKIKEIIKDAPTYYNCILENGDKGTIWKHNTSNPAIGEEIDYELTENPNSNFLPTIKLSRKTIKAVASASLQQNENVRFAIQMAVNLKVAGVNKDSNGKELSLSESTECMLKIIEKYSK